MDNRKKVSKWFTICLDWWHSLLKHLNSQLNSRVRNTWWLMGLCHETIVCLFTLIIIPVISRLHPKIYTLEPWFHFPKLSPPIDTAPHVRMHGSHPTNPHFDVKLVLLGPTPYTRTWWRWICIALYSKYICHYKKNCLFSHISNAKRKC